MSLLPKLPGIFILAYLGNRTGVILDAQGISPWFFFVIEIQHRFGIKQIDHIPDQSGSSGNTLPSCGHLKVAVRIIQPQPVDLGIA
jgi:hypothetical protein